MDAILPMNAVGSMMMGLSVLSSTVYYITNNSQSFDVPTGALVAVFYNVGQWSGSRTTKSISMHPWPVAVPASGSTQVILTGYRYEENGPITITEEIATLSKIKLQANSYTCASVLWLG